MKSRGKRHLWQDPFLKGILAGLLLPISTIGLLATLIPHALFHDRSEPTGDLPYYFAALLLVGLVLLASSLRDALSPWSRLYRLMHPELWRRVQE